MLCPKCHGKCWVLVSVKAEYPGLVERYRPCDCHAGQVSCSEGSERTGGVKDMEAEKRGVFKAAYEERGG